MDLYKFQVVDFTPRKTSFYLCTRYVEGSISGDPILKHWIWKVECGKRTFFLDADNEDGKLTPRISFKEPINIDTIDYIDTIVISLTEIVQKGRAVKYNNTMYHVVFVNCQTWILELYELLNLKANKDKLVTSADMSIKLIETSYDVFGAPGALVSVGLIIFSSMFSGWSSKSTPDTSQRAIQHSASAATHAKI